MLNYRDPVIPTRVHGRVESFSVRVRYERESVGSVERWNEGDKDVEARDEVTKRALFHQSSVLRVQSGRSTTEVHTHDSARDF